MQRLLTAAMTAALVATAGCIVLVSDVPGESECRFQGADSECGQCTRARCGAMVDACCGDRACATVLQSLDACASRHDQSCAALVSPPSDGSGGAAALSSCIAQRCAPWCTALSGKSETTCKEAQLAPAAACSCTVDGSPNDMACSEAVERGTICCAAPGWPAPGLECACRRVSCNPTKGGCFCSLVDYAPEHESCSGQFCCVRPGQDDQCVCRSYDCYDNERRVESCSAAVMGCGAQQREASCSRRTP